jgi:SAM-dependent methyltransferase
MNPSSSLQTWIPRLISLWRKQTKLRGQDNRLEPSELRQVGQGIRQLSEGLTGTRRLVGKNYLEDPALLGAYLLYYWPISYTQASWALKRLHFAPGSESSALDLGSGPGPVTAALLDAGIHKVTAVDQSPAALTLLRGLTAMAGHTVETRVSNVSNPTASTGSFDLITFGHVLNELWATNPGRIQMRSSFLTSRMAFLKPEGMALILEPALFNITRDLLALRDIMVKQGSPVRFPCLWRQGCPALASDTGTCHGEIGWEPPVLVRDLAYHANLYKEDLKAGVLALGKPGSAWPQVLSDKTFRIVSEPLLSKSGRTRLLGCGPEGRLALSTSRQEAANWTGGRDFYGLRRGDLVRIEGVQPRESGYGLGQETKLEVLESEGRKPTQPGGARGIARKGSRKNQGRGKGPFRG